VGTFVCFFQFCTGTFTAAVPAGLRAIVEMGRDECKIAGHSSLFRFRALKYGDFSAYFGFMLFKFSLSSILTYPASRVSFDLSRKKSAGRGKRLG